MVTDGFGEAWISTIHAFAARLIRESGLSLDVDPRASVVSSPQEDAFWNAIGDAAEGADLRGMARLSGDARLRAAAVALDDDRTLGAALDQWDGAKLRDLARNTDRKSTRLNSSHQLISYAVFCLKKKKTA